MGVSFVVSVYLQTERHYSAIKTGVIFTAATRGRPRLLAGRRADGQAAASEAALIGGGFLVTVIGIVLLLVLVGGASRARGRSRRACS